MLKSFLKFIGHQHWIIPGIRKRIIWFFFNRGFLQDFGFDTPFYNATYKGNTKNYIDRFVYFFGAYELGMLELIREFLGDKKDKVFLDIGANIGHHSLFASMYAKEVHSFEPYWKVRNVLESRMIENKISNIIVHPYGLGSKNETIPYYEPSDSNTGTGSFINQYTTDNAITGTNLEVKVGDEIILPFEKVDVVKIDVEGFEVEVLSGLLNSLKKFKPYIIMEYSENTRDKLFKNESILSFLKDSFKIRRFRNPNDLPPQVRDADLSQAGFVDLIFIPKR